MLSQRPTNLLLCRRTEAWLTNTSLPGKNDQDLCNGRKHAAVLSFTHGYSVQKVSVGHYQVKIERHKTLEVSPIHFGATLRGKKPSGWGVCVNRTAIRHLMGAGASVASIQCMSPWYMVFARLWYMYFCRFYRIITHLIMRHIQSAIFAANDHRVVIKTTNPITLRSLPCARENLEMCHWALIISIRGGYKNWHFFLWLWLDRFDGWVGKTSPLLITISCVGSTEGVDISQRCRIIEINHVTWPYDVT